MGTILGVEGVVASEAATVDIVETVYIERLLVTAADTLG